MYTTPSNHKEFSMNHLQAANAAPVLLPIENLNLESNGHNALAATCPQEQGQQVHIQFLSQPVNEYRFRYTSEKGNHGQLMSSGDDSRFPTIEIKNLQFSGPVEIIVSISLYTWEREPKLHQILRFQDQMVTNTKEYKCTNRNGTFYAELTGIRIIKLTQKILQRRFGKTHEEADRIYNEYHNLPCCLRIVAKRANQVIAGPVYSSMIRDLSPSLRIDQISSQRVRRGDELWLLTDRVKSNDIQVVLTDETANWEITCKIEKIHHQYTVICKIPPPKEHDTRAGKPMKLFLFRPSDGRKSKPVDLTYVDEFLPHKKKREYHGDVEDEQNCSVLDDYSASAGNCQRKSPLESLQAEDVADFSFKHDDTLVREQINTYSVTSSEPAKGKQMYSQPYVSQIHVSEEQQIAYRQQEQQIQLQQQQTLSNLNRSQEHQSTLQLQQHPNSHGQLPMQQQRQQYHENLQNQQNQPHSLHLFQQLQQAQLHQTLEHKHQTQQQEQNHIQLNDLHSQDFMDIGQQVQPFVFQLPSQNPLHQQSPPHQAITISTGDSQFPPSPSNHLSPEMYHEHSMTPQLSPQLPGYLHQSSPYPQQENSQQEYAQHDLSIFDLIQSSGFEEYEFDTKPSEHDVSKKDSNKEEEKKKETPKIIREIEIDPDLDLYTSMSFKEEKGNGFARGMENLFPNIATDRVSPEILDRYFNQQKGKEESDDDISDLEEKEDGKVRTKENASHNLPRDDLLPKAVDGEINEKHEGKQNTHDLMDKDSAKMTGDKEEIDGKIITKENNFQDLLSDGDFGKNKKGKERSDDDLSDRDSITKMSNMKKKEVEESRAEKKIFQNENNFQELPTNCMCSNTADQDLNEKYESSKEGDKEFKVENEMLNTLQTTENQQHTEEEIAEGLTSQMGNMHIGKECKTERKGSNKLKLKNHNSRNIVKEKTANTVAEFNSDSKSYSSSDTDTEATLGLNASTNRVRKLKRYEAKLKEKDVNSMSYEAKAMDKQLIALLKELTTEEGNIIREERDCMQKIRELTKKERKIKSREKNLILARQRLKNGEAYDENREKTHDKSTLLCQTKAMKRSRDHQTSRKTIAASNIYREINTEWNPSKENIINKEFWKTNGEWETQSEETLDEELCSEEELNSKGIKEEEEIHTCKEMTEKAEMMNQGSIGISFRGERVNGRMISARKRVLANSVGTEEEKIWNRWDIYQNGQIKATQGKEICEEEEPVNESNDVTDMDEMINLRETVNKGNDIGNEYSTCENCSERCEEYELKPTQEVTQNAQEEDNQMNERITSLTGEEKMLETESRKDNNRVSERREISNTGGRSAIEAAKTVDVEERFSDEDIRIVTTEITDDVNNDIAITDLETDGGEMLYISKDSSLGVIKANPKIEHRREFVTEDDEDTESKTDTQIKVGLEIEVQKDAEVSSERDFLQEIQRKNKLAIQYDDETSVESQMQCKEILNAEEYLETNGDEILHNKVSGTEHTDEVHQDLLLEKEEDKTLNGQGSEKEPTELSEEESKARQASVIVDATSKLATDDYFQSSNYEKSLNQSNQNHTELEEEDNRSSSEMEQNTDKSCEEMGDAYDTKEKTADGKLWSVTLAGTYENESYGTYESNKGRDVDDVDHPCGYSGDIQDGYNTLNGEERMERDVDNTYTVEMDINQTGDKEECNPNNGEYANAGEMENYKEESDAVKKLKENDTERRVDGDKDEKKSVKENSHDSSDEDEEVNAEENSSGTSNKAAKVIGEESSSGSSDEDDEVNAEEKSSSSCDEDDEANAEESSSGSGDEDDDVNAKENSSGSSDENDDVNAKENSSGSSDGDDDVNAEENSSGSSDEDDAVNAEENSSSSSDEDDVNAEENPCDSSDKDDENSEENSSDSSVEAHNTDNDNPTDSEDKSDSTEDDYANGISDRGSENATDDSDNENSSENATHDSDDCSDRDGTSDTTDSENADKINTCMLRCKFNTTNGKCKTIQNRDAVREAGIRSVSFSITTDSLRKKKHSTDEIQETDGDTSKATSEEGRRKRDMSSKRRGRKNNKRSREKIRKNKTTRTQSNKENNGYRWYCNIQ